MKKYITMLGVFLFVVRVAAAACDDPCSQFGGGLEGHYNGTTSIGTYKCICAYNCQAWNSPSKSCVGAPANNCGDNDSARDSGYTVKNTTSYNYDPYQNCKPATTYCKAVCQSGCKTCAA
jgi:hypothetical protein